MSRRLALIGLAAAVGSASIGLLAPTAGAEDPPSLVARGQFSAVGDDDGEAGTEISTFDPSTDRLFSTNGAQNRLDVVDLADIDAPTLIDSIDLGPYGTGVQSVAAHDGLVAVVVSSSPKTDPGRLVLFDAATLAERNALTVGALPDMVTFTPDGSTILVANEAEPLCTAFDDDTDTATFVDPDGSVSVVDVSGGAAAATVDTATFTAFNGQKAALAASGVRFNFFDNTVAQQLEPEYISVSEDGATAWVSLQEANAVGVLDIGSATFTDIIPLGLKDHSTGRYDIDASNEDGPGGDELAGNFQTWPVSGMYMPDALAAFTIAGTEYFMTANEGDAREWFVGDDEDDDLCFADVERVKDLTLDTTLPEFSDPAIQDDDRLGRLNATTTAWSQRNGEDEYTELAVFGGRSATIWNGATGAIVWDSADDIATDLEQITLANGTFADNRSDDKGSEPEAVAVAEAYGRTLAVVGLERTSGVVLYDISEPTAPAFLQYIAPAGDESVEGLFFISAADSPSGRPLVLASHEVSSTVRVLEVFGTEPVLDVATPETPGASQTPVSPTATPLATRATPTRANPSFTG